MNSVVLSPKQFLGTTQIAQTTSRTVRATKTVRVTAVLKTKSSGKTASNGKQKVAAQTFKVTVGRNKDGSLKKKNLTLGFTADNELLVGRAAMIGVVASLVGEILTGKGAIAQIGLETGLPIYEVDGLILALIAFNFIAAFAPVAGKFVPEETFDDRSKGALQDPTVSLLDPKKFFGTSGFGFTKANELFVGRMAQLGFAASLLGEAITGKGILGQIGLETGIPLNESEPLLLFFIAFTVFAAINPGTGKFVTDEE